MRAFLEKIGNEWLDDFVYSSVLPLKNMGIEIIPFDGTDLNKFTSSNSFNINNDIIIGSVEATCAFFKECNIEIPKYLGYPNELYPYLNRKVKIQTYSELLSGSTEYPFFVKPYSDVKLFTGSVVDNISQLNLLKFFNNKINVDTQLYVSECISLISEYRCFVYNKKLVGIKNYSGDFTEFPDYNIILEMIDKYENSPVAYTLDVAIDDKLNTVLIEVNDFWAIGGYGFDGDLYVKMIIDRIRQIAGLPTRKEINSKYKF